ncbi:MAG: prolyl oligopeptidase family serine peptidase [Planctomycetota bacterium]
MKRTSPFAAVLALALTPPIAMTQHADAQAIPAPPATEQRPVTDTLHGVEITDPYRWLEGDEQGNATDEVDAWTAAQNAHTRAVLDSLPGRDAVEARLRELMSVGYVGRPAMRENLYFNTQREGDQNQAVLYVREGHDGEPRVLLDVNALDETGLTALSWWVPSQDGKLLAFGTYEAGDENSTLNLMDVATGTWLADEIPGKVGRVQWLPDGKSFFYSCLEDVNNPYSAQIKYHVIGQHHSQDRVLFEQYKEGPLATTWGPFFDMDRDGRWGVIGYYTSTSSNDLWLINVADWLRGGELEMVPMIEGADANSYPVFLDRLGLLVQTQVDAPNGAVFRVDTDNPARENWTPLIPHRDDMVLEGVQESADDLYAEYSYRASTRIERFSFGGRALGEVELPGIGSASLTTRFDRSEAYLGFTSFNTPSSIYRLDISARPKIDEYELWHRVEVPVDPSLVEVKQVTYQSADGTDVTMFIVHKKGLELDGTNPTLLSGYGGFGISMTPYFSATRFPWFEAGGVYAIPNLRGGGEYGDDWHKAGTLGEKQNVYDDFIAAAEYLIAEGYTNPDKLAISGGSNGGLLMGAMMTQRPELFEAVICAVPLLDMLRYQDFLMARYWVPEYGDPAIAEHFEWLHAYSPYHNVDPEADYPALFFTAGENDTRVHPLHARKMAALMQYTAQHNGDADPVLLWVDQDGGHGGGKPLDLRVRDVADGRMFLMWRLGMLAGQ